MRSRVQIRLVFTLPLAPLPPFPNNFNSVAECQKQKQCQLKGKERTLALLLEEFTASYTLMQ